MDDIALSITTTAQFGGAIVLLLAFSFLAFWRDNTLLYMFLAALAVMFGFWVFDLWGGWFWLSTFLVMTIYGIACLTIALTKIWQRYRSGREVNNGE